ncbi:putative ferric-chelate reductase 1 homolog isoform X1 [Drosophila guanche]|uniref:Blast:Putative ferric-chelate reductase 1 homolog n=2 Tax=Drosophila guanche TaxID=7266 RepID=A0A3B0IZQ1_DROGU|nr:putative ferric-chelate reductase 1 homolog isoform X1 [Drosophila guanche]SPP73934.1 blast:Putative ferric-chelate reductase 1 homolog [Drosophila guanche]
MTGTVRMVRRARKGVGWRALAMTMSLLVMATWLEPSQSLPQGAPETVCDTMLPFHSGGSVLPQNSVSPFSVETSASTVGQGQTVRVDVTGVPEGLTFGGFMVQARNRNPPHQIVGQFSPARDGTVKLMNCENSVNNSATHSNAGAKPQVYLEWQSPVDFLGQVVFNATIAQSYSEFWVGVPSNPVQIVRRDLGAVPLPTAGPQPAFGSALPTTRAPYVPPNYVAPSAVAATADPFYNGCGVSKNCFGFPDGCVNTKTCTSVAAVTVRGDIYEFEIQSGRGNNAAYVAVGLSDDAKMGEDLTTECVPENGRVTMYSSYTSATPYAAVRTSVPQNSARLLNASLVDGVIYCRVARDPVTVVKGRTFDLRRQQYHLLVASGSSLKENSVGYHDIGRLPSGKAINLAEVQDLSGSSNLLVQLHGAFMIAAWIGTTSLGIIFARYFKQTWVGSQSCGKDQWFAWHRLLMVTTWSLTIAAYILIWVELKRAVWHAHSIIGLITVILCFLQPIGALFRPGPNDKKRPYFNWGHWLGGNLAHILGIVTIFFSVKLPKAELPEWMDWILVAFVVVHVLVHLIFSIGLCLNHWQITGMASERHLSQRANTFQMGEMSPHHQQHAMRNGMSMERKMDAPYGAMRKGLLGVYGVVLVLFVVVLILLVVLAPIEQFLGKS